MKNLNWIDYLHYVMGIGLMIAAALTQAGVSLPGVTVNPTTAGAAGVGILAAGLKGGWTSGSK